ncbi:uncharacterized protein N7469_006769 [Penicillium citrinum]|uniref:DUF6699 domain-containing protein n=2 Tax=Penicillium TaxID=5073 RepID=A0A9W9NXG5_PENCI|nr:uncharacterized protein N7469_006769 [Penicillium citrinum]KAJ5226763.1 hypothetical protein N7469_006769 [Penicillium citrinum]KAJ5568779.1 hypothetical protein N7450_011265 [Penicillium hetheringtonii]
MTVPLTKVDSAIAGLSIEDNKPPVSEEKETKKTHKRTSSQGENVWNILDLEAKKIELELPIETQKTGWRLNKPPSSIEDKDILKMYLVNPPVKKIDLHFPLGLTVTARNLKGVTIKDALDAIHKPYKKKKDDELDKPYLKGFEWDKEESWTSLIVHQTNEAPPQESTGKKSKKKNKSEA